ncbi:hypothetical protein MNBD_GAMMA24-1738 [hydrothermal vent metagenome]|uniref:YfdX protein n=1 Tax=hydrothermal vent metagenome TaxID=652676 RepID=A0A3B1BMQ9_9ZZZZ
MNVQHKPSASLIAGIIASSILISSPVLASALHEKITIKPGRQINAHEQSIISHSAASALRHIAQARADIHDKNLANAKNELAQVRKLVNIIKSARPTSKVIDHIWVAKKHLDYKNTVEVGEDIIPIDVGLTEIEDLVPVEQARQHLKRASKHLKEGQAKAAREELDAVQDNLIYTEVDLPLANTEQAVIMAQSLLARNKPSEADQALALAEDGVQYLSVTVAAPLSQARKSIYRAMNNYAAKKYDKTRAELAVASGWLKKAAKKADHSSEKKITHMQQLLQSLSSKLSKKDKKAEVSLEGLWHRIIALSEYEAEKIGLGHSQKQASANTIKKNLIDSKLDIAYAETAQLIDHDKNGLIYNLKLAKAALKRARNAANKTGKQDIHKIEKDINKIESVTLTGLKDADYTLARWELLGFYEKTKADQRKLIRDQ